MNELTYYILAALFYSSGVVSPPQTTPRLDDYWQAVDGPDYVPAFERAQKACVEANKNNHPAVPSPTGCVLELGAKNYPLSRTVNVCVPLSIKGQGIGAAFASSSFTIQKQTAFKTWSSQQACPLGIGYNGVLSMEHVTITNTGKQSNATDKPFYAIDASQKVFLDDVGGQYFVIGVYLSCDSVYSKTNCNLSRFYNVNMRINEYAGFFMVGGDSNASTIDGSSAGQNCRYPDKWIKQYTAPYCGKYPNTILCKDKHYQCAGFMDFSFLGNLYQGTHTAGNISVAQPGLPAVSYAGYVFAGANQKTTGIGLYAEDDTSLQYFDKLCNIVGGGNVFNGSGGQIHGTEMPALTILNDMDPNNRLRVNFGFNTGLGGTVMSTTSTGIAVDKPIGLKLDTKKRMLYFDISNSIQFGTLQFP